MTIGDRIKHAMEIRGMTQKELANKTRTSEVTISRWVNNSRTPNAKAIKVLCRALYISADWLLGLRNDEND